MSDEQDVSETIAPKPRRVARRRSPDAASATTAPDTGSGASADQSEGVSTPTSKSLRAPFVQRNFVQALIAGGTLALFGVSAHPVATGVGLLGPILVVILFYVQGRRQGWSLHADTRQRFADACYFLGFLFTMWALLVGFVPAGIGLHELASTEILRHFGMALGATAAGLICRILVLQSGGFEDDVAGIEADLHAFAMKVTTEASSIAEGLTAARDRILEEQGRAVDAATARFQSALEQMTERMGASIDAAAGKLVTGAEDAERAVRTFERLAVERGAELDRSSRAEIDAQVLLRDANLAAAEQMGRFATELAEARNGVTQAVASVSEQLRRLNEGIDGMDTDAAGIAAAAGNLGERITAAHAEIDSLAATAVAARVDLGSHRMEMVELRRAADAQVADDRAQFTTSVKAANQEFARIVDGLTEELARVRTGDAAR